MGGYVPKDYAAWYGRATRWWRERPGRVAALRAASECMKYAFYLLYPAALALAWLAGVPARDVAALVAVPAAGFALLTWLRVWVNEPRPYEACGISPLIPKATSGKSFPSRHVFSVFAIAMCWLWLCEPVGTAMLAAGCLMGAVRVLGGVHYPHDVAAAGILGVCWGLLLWVV